MPTSGQCWAAAVPGWAPRCSAVKDQLGYRPDAYIAAVSRRRLASYGAQIHAGETALLAPGPGRGTAREKPKDRP